MTLTVEDRKLSIGIAKYTGEKRSPKLKIKRHFTYPNKDPYEDYNGQRDKYALSVIREKIENITDKGIENLFFDEEDSFAFEAELSYLVINKFTDIHFRKINLVDLFYNKKFNIDSFLQAIKIISISMLILSDIYEAS